MNITGVEINIEDIHNLVPLVNNNIIEFKKIVHRLSSNYKNNRLNINLIHKKNNDINNNIIELKNKYEKLNTLIIRSRIDNINNIIRNREIDKKITYLFIGNLFLTGILVYFF